jgi:hypothetical protein
MDGTGSGQIHPFAFTRAERFSDVRFHRISYIYSSHFSNLTLTSMKKILILIMAGSLSLALPAQKTIDILSLSGRYGLPGEYNDPAVSGKATEIGSLNSLQVGFNILANTQFVLNLNHFYFNVSGDPDPMFHPELAYPVKVNGIIMRVGLRQYFKGDRYLQVLVMPKLMSDFQNMDGNSFQFGGAVVYRKQFRDELAVGIGAMYSAELFGPYLVPIVDLYWQFAEKWRLWGMLPITARLEYDVNKNMMVGFNHFGLITTYYLGHEDYTGDYMERQSIDLSLFARHRLAGNIFLEAMAGMAVGRHYRQYEGDQKLDFAIPLVTFGDDRVVKREIDTGFGDGLILTLKLIYNMPMPQRPKY